MPWASISARRTGIASTLSASLEMARDGLGVEGTPVTVRGDRALLRRLTRNLIENALRHTPPGTQVCVEVWAAPGETGVSVSDDGQRAGAPAAAAAAASGLGLGLRLVERMAEQMGAELLRDTGEATMTTRFALRWRTPGTRP